MLYSNSKIVLGVLITASSCLSCLADNTIIIKKYKKPSRALLNKKIIYMDMGAAPTASKTSSKGLSALAAPIQASKPITRSLPQKSYQVKSLNKKGFGVNTLAKKSKLDSIGKNLSKSFNRKTGGKAGDLDAAGKYSDDDWGDYTEYRDVVMEESLGVSARIKR